MRALLTVLATGHARSAGAFRVTSSSNVVSPSIHRSAVAGARLLLSGLQQQGHEVLTEHLFEDDAFESDSRLSPREIYERDVDWLRSADVVVVEASGSSFEGQRDCQAPGSAAC